MSKQIMDEVRIDLTITLTETGNVWLSGFNQEHVFMRLGEGLWLEVLYRTHSYPAWEIKTIRKTDAELANWINENRVDWEVMRNNLDGLRTNDEFGSTYITETGDDDDEQTEAGSHDQT